MHLELISFSANTEKQNCHVVLWKKNSWKQKFRVSSFCNVIKFKCSLCSGLSFCRVFCAENKVIKSTEKNFNSSGKRRIFLWFFNAHLEFMDFCWMKVSHVWGWFIRNGNDVSIRFLNRDNTKSIKDFHIKSKSSTVSDRSSSNG